MFVDKIFAGYKIQTETATYEVLGSLSIRGRYAYTVKDVKNGKKLSISREDLMQAQKEGSATITM
jgi:hypothetical protein